MVWRVVADKSGFVEKRGCVENLVLREKVSHFILKSQNKLSLKNL